MSTPKIGDVIDGKYRVERVLGAGGMGVVLEAHHLDLDEPVAIKLLHPALAGSATDVARFLREGRAASKLRSSHVVRVLDVARLADGAPYLVMERLDGQDLASALEAAGALPIAQAVDWVVQAAEAVAEAHALGIVHRDLKPSNLFLARGVDGSLAIKVLDFGIARLRSSGAAPAITADNAAIGTPLYMAPEAIEGGTEPDPRGDVYALGVVLYELVSGTTPYVGESALALAAKIASKPPRPLGKALPGVDRAFEAVVMRCLAREPGRRYQTVSHLVDDLAPFAGTPAAERTERTDRIVRVVAEASARAQRREGDPETVKLRRDDGTASAWGVRHGRGGGRANGRGGSRLALVLAAASLILGFGVALGWALLREPVREPPKAAASESRRPARAARPTEVLPSASVDEAESAESAENAPSASASTMAAPASSPTTSATASVSASTTKPRPRPSSPSVTFDDPN